MVCVIVNLIVGCILLISSKKLWSSEIDPQNINIKFSRWIKLFKRWHFYCKKNKISKIEGAVNFVLKTNKIKKIVVGFTNTEEFIEFLKIKTKKKLTVPKLLISKIKNIEKLINPYNWKT